MDENYQRLEHLSHAVDQLEKNKEKLIKNFNLIRQEEITQDIEVIMLSVETITREIHDEVTKGH